MSQSEETRGEFEARYIKPPGMLWGRDLISLPCCCEDGGGPWHWEAVRNDPESIARHNKLESFMATEGQLGETNH